LYRSETDKIIGGVCGGLAAYWGFDPLILRILFVVLAMMDGIGVVAYILLWIFVPAESATNVARGETVRQNVQEIEQRAHELGHEASQAIGHGWHDWDATDKSGKRIVAVGALLVAVGLLVLLRNFGLLWWFNLGKLWPLLLIALGAVVLLNNLKERR
jgi:phage shock protein C